MKTRVLIPIAAALLVAPTAASAAAVPAQAGDWTAWYGCWRAVDTTNGTGPLICVLPGDGPAAVRMATVENGEITDETMVRADGVARPIAEGGCTGTESAFFSADGRRIFTRAELECSGLDRVSTGMLAIISEEEWVDAQALTVNEQHAARTIRYRAADASELPTWLAVVLPQGRDLAQETARLDASMPLDVEAVAEASRYVAAPALEAMLAERAHGFGLDAKKLVQLRDLGVPTSTIDVMVALSYPAKFAVAPRQYDSDRGTDDLDREYARAGWADDCYEPYGSMRRYDCYDSRYGNRYGYGYSYRDRYGYGYDPYRWNYGSTPVVVIVRSPDEGESRTGGAVVKGRGYSRTGATTTRGTATTRGSDRTSSGATTVRSGSSSTTTRSSPPSSSGGSTQPRRSAKPRGGGGGN